MEKLSSNQMAVLAEAPFEGPRPGSNFWPLLEIKTRFGNVSGEVIDGLARNGFLFATERAKPIILPASNEDIAEFEVELVCDYDLTAEGRAALSEGSTL